MERNIRMRVRDELLFATGGCGTVDSSSWMIQAGKLDLNRFTCRITHQIKILIYE